MGALGSLLAMAAVVYYIYRLFQKGKEKNLHKVELFKAFGEKHSLKHGDSNYLHVKLNQLVGKINDYASFINEEMEGHGKSKIIITSLNLHHDKLDFEFSIMRKKFISKHSRRKGLQNIEMDYPKFDELFVVKTDDETKMKRLLNQNRMNDLVSQKDTFYGELAVTSTKVVYVFKGALLEEKHWSGFESMIHFILDFLERR